MIPFVQDIDFTLYVGDVREVLAGLPDESVDCCVTSPPYWGLRDYGAAGQIGLEATPGEYVAAMAAVFAEVRRVLRSDGTCWLNLGDSYAGSGKGPSNSSELVRPQRGMSNVAAAPNRWLSAPDGIKSKDLIGIPWRVAFALQSDGWWLRSDIIWAKPNPMPESVTDRPTKAHEYLFLLTKSARYFYDADAIREAYLDEAGTRRPNVFPDGWASEGSHNVVDHSRRARGPDGRRKTAVRGQDGSIQHRDGERWPNPAGRNARTVWEIATEPYAEAHFATFPQELARRCIAAGCPAGGTVLDPFLGSGTTALVARRLGRKSVGIELNPAYAEMCARRLGQQSLLAEETA